VKKFKSYLIYIFLVFASDKLQGQSLNTSGTFSVKNHTSLSLTYNNINDLLKTKIIPAAIEIQVPASVDKNDIYATISFSKGFNKQNIGLKFNLDNAIGVGVGSPDEVILSDTPLKVLSLSKAGTAGTSIYYFDVIVHGISTFIEPDNYRFTINFSNVN
jgi:hypothetical protein